MTEIEVAVTVSIIFTIICVVDLIRKKGK